MFICAIGFIIKLIHTEASNVYCLKLYSKKDSKRFGVIRSPSSVDQCEKLKI